MFQAVERLARLRGLHITDDAKGNWVANILDPKGASQGQLVEGNNLLEARATIDGSRSFKTSSTSSASAQVTINQWHSVRDVSATLTNPNARRAPGG